MAASIKNLFDKGIASVTVKSSTFLETSKLSNQINMAEGEIPRQKTLMGEAAYLAWCEQRDLLEVVTPYCQEIQSLEAQIAELQRKIAELKEESQKALGEEARPEGAPAPGGKAFCTACGTENAQGARFCCKCGNKM